MSDIVGLALRDGRVDVAALRAGLGARRLITAFSVPADEDSAATIRRQLLEDGVRARRVQVGLPRRAVVAKAVELPVVPGADLRRMVGFELERHLPFPPSDALFDFEVLDSGAGRPVRILLVAVERRSHERVRQLLRDAGLVPRLVGVAIHSLARLAAGGAARGRIVVWLEAADAELAVVVRGRVVASRAFPVPPDPDARGRALETEITRTLATLPESERAELTEVVVGGVSPPTFGVETLAVHTGIADLGDFSTSEDASLPALAAALERPGRRLPVANLLPEELRPRPFPWPLAATAALALLTLGIGAAIPTVAFVKERRALAALEASIARLAPEVQRAERLAADVERARRELTTLLSFEEQGLHPLPVLRELTDTLPADAWLTNLSVDRTGLELGGFANAASQLIPLLEASPALERVEFTSPVTKGRDREQFRLRATWERRGEDGRMPALRPRERRLLLLAALLGIGVAGYVYVAEPLIERHAATRELTVARRGLLARQERLIARSEGYGRDLEVLRAEIARHQARLLAGDKAPVAASELQKLVKTTAQEAGIDVRSERILAPVDRGGYAEVPVEVTLSGPIRGLTAFLHRLEDAPILLAVTDLKVRSPASGAARDLSATIALSGFIPATGAPGTPPRPAVAPPGRSGG